jgi:hypothetical protein
MATCHIIINTDDASEARSIALEVIERNHDIQRDLDNEAVQLTFTAYPRHKILGLIIVNPVLYKGKVFIRPVAEPVKQEIVELQP